MSLVVISYDIIDDNRRNKVSKVLLDYGERVQYSVFEVSVPDKLPEIKERLTKLIDTKEDNIMYYLLCRSCKEKKVVTGQERASTVVEAGPIII